ncbi:hypothetical protein AJ80_07134 [Polytolypa hystricis UAMH7299]|uniref:GTP binding protein n=1 Tax=Polytolypa hystricis (strain UAMH7299) TaxID=1447883 RepID=A0A2B7XIA1_POLH7|nr:hypothetical protein AJ80_07134 [Polytolypa hystricis UAMH7299]
MENSGPISKGPAHGQGPAKPMAATEPDDVLNDPSSDSLPLKSLPEDSPPPCAPARDGEKLSKEAEEKMFRALQEIFREAEEEEDNFDVTDLLAALEVADDQSKRGRQNPQVLKGVRMALDKLWRSGSDYMAQAAEVLANGSRNPAWRAPYGRSGILDFFLRVIASNGVDADILLHSLRLVGNSCADTDENRQLVTERHYTIPIIRLFGNPEVVHVAIPVMYNICADFEPAQAEAAKNGVGYALLKLLTENEIEGNALLTYSYELVEMSSEQAQGIERSPDDTLSMILRLANDPDLSFAHFSYIVNCLVAYLQNERFQRRCISETLVGSVVSVLGQSFDIDPVNLSPEDTPGLAQLRLTLNQALSDISALPLFSKAYPLGSELSTTLLSWLDGPEDQLQICACVMLGNLAREDGICEAMIRDYNIHVPLITILKNDDARGSVLHAVLGILKNLAIAGNNKEHLGATEIIKATSPLWSLDAVPQVQFAATSLARLVIVSSLKNAARLLEPLSSDPDSPAHYRTYLSLLLSLFGKTDSSPIKTEIGRTIAAVCRTLKQKSAEDSILAERFFKLHEDVARPLGAMVVQTQWPVVQSEGWFALALMASSPLGSLAVVDCLQDIDIFQLLSETVRASTDEAPREETTNEITEKLRKAKDRDNALILINGLLTNNPSTLPGTRRDMLADLLREAGQERPLI